MCECVCSCAHKASGLARITQDMLLQHWYVPNIECLDYRKVLFKLLIRMPVKVLHPSQQLWYEDYKKAFKSGVFVENSTGKLPFFVFPFE